MTYGSVKEIKYSYQQQALSTTKNKCLLSYNTVSASWKQQTSPKSMDPDRLAIICRGMKCLLANFTIYTQTKWIIASQHKEEQK